MNWKAEGVTVRAVGGGLWIAQSGYGLLLDVPTHAGLHLTTREFAELGTIALSGGRIGSIGGLVPLLCALEPHRAPDVPLVLVGPLGDDRGSQLASAWTQGWPGRYPITMDSLAPGQAFDAGPFEVETVAILRGEPRWRPEPAIDRVTAMGFRVHTAAGVVVFLPGAGPGSLVERASAGARLTVVEVGTIGWPPDDRPWRIGLSDAATLASEELWILDERGRSAAPSDAN